MTYKNKRIYKIREWMSFTDKVSKQLNLNPNNNELVIGRITKNNNKKKLQKLKI